VGQWRVGQQHTRGHLGSGEGFDSQISIKDPLTSGTKGVSSITWHRAPGGERNLLVLIVEVVDVLVQDQPPNVLQRKLLLRPDLEACTKAEHQQKADASQV